MRPLATQTILLVMLALPLRAQATESRGVIDAVVTDSNSVPLSGVEATIAGSNLRTKTSDIGRFRFVALPAGQYVLGLRREGSVSVAIDVQVVAGDTVRLSLELQAARPGSEAGSPNAPIVASRQAAFDLHRARGGGQFMTAAEIAARNATRTQQLFGGFSSVDVTHVLAVDHDVPNYYRAPCALQLFVDGELVRSLGFARLPLPAQLLGIEVYARADAVPADVEFNRTRACGAVLMWTKSGG